MSQTGHSTQEWLEIADKTGHTSYAPARLVLTRGEGMHLYDTEGRAYLDFMAGIAVTCLGHSHPRLVQAVQEQAGRLMQISNVFVSDAQLRLQEALLSACFADRVFLCNSGAEANEAALKLARRYQRVHLGQTGRTETISFKNSFHGRTLATVTATGQPKYHKGFEPLPPGFVYAEYNDLASVEALIGPQTTAVLVEPVQGEGGILPAAPGFLEGLRRLCDEHGALLIFDEVQAGVGRLGTLFAYEHFGVQPDIVTMAKGLGGGVPIGAMVSTEEIFQGFTRGSHATTFGGNPLVCAAAAVVLEEVSQPAFLAQVRRVGAYLQERLRQEDWPLEAGQVRGVGLMVGMELGEKAGAVASAALEEGLILNTAGGTVLRFVPPLVAQEAHVDEAIEKLRAAMAKVACQQG